MSINDRTLDVVRVGYVDTAQGMMQLQPLAASNVEN